MEELDPGKEARRVAIYMRVSTVEQKIDGYSLEAQRKRLLEFVEGHSAFKFVTKPAWIFEDTHTGSDLNRTNLTKLRKMVREKKFDAVLVWKIDRLSRNLKHLLTVFEELESNDVSFISMQENIDFKGPIGKLIFQIFGAIAQFERELIKGRSHMGIIASAEMGNYTGSNIPYGYQPIKNKGGKGKRIIPLPEEKRWVERMFEWYVYEDAGFHIIANKLNELGVHTGKHKRRNNKASKWSAEMVSKILKNPLYKGTYVANKKDEMGNELPEDKWTIVKIPPCTSEYLFLQAQSLLGKKLAGHSKDRIYILSGKLKDMTLENPKTFVGCKRTKGGFSYRRKQFKDKNGVHQSVFEVPAEQLDNWAIGKIKAALKDPQMFVEEYLSKQYSDKTKVKKIEEELDQVRDEKIRQELAIERIESAYETGAYSEEKMIEKGERANKKIHQLNEREEALKDELRFIGSINVEVSKLQEASKQIKYQLDKLTPRQKRILVDLFIERIEMFRTKDDKGKSRVWGEVHFRFNPDKLFKAVGRGRTPKALTLAKNAKKIPTEPQSGATTEI